MQPIIGKHILTQPSSWRQRRCGIPQGILQTWGELETTIQGQVDKAILNLTMTKREQEVFVAVIDKYKDVFRIRFGHDEPTKFKPLKVRLKPGSTPIRVKNRSYSELHMKKMREVIDELLKNKLIYQNTESRWAAPANMVAKPGRPEDYRLTIDLRYINSCTIPIQNPMPILDDVLRYALECLYFITGDFLQGYWQIMLDENDQEYFSFITPFGVFTPTRLPQGSVDAPLYFQGCLQQAFQELIKEGRLIVWIDDIIGFAKTWDEYIDLLSRIFEVCLKWGLKLHAKKTNLGDVQATYCGRIINGLGVKMNPRNYETFLNMSTPQYAGELASFVHGITWMNTSLPRLNEHMAPLQNLLEKIYKEKGSRKRRKYETYNLHTMGAWTDVEQTAYDECKKILADPVMMAHPLQDQESDVCVLTDASHHFYAGMVTQVVKWNETKPVDEQHHRPLATISGQFKHAQLNWSTIEKEAYPIIEVCTRFTNLLIRPRGIRVYTDHANIVHLYHPEVVRPPLSVAATQKIYRWLAVLNHFKITHMEHLSGPKNVWCDLLSRWANSDYHALLDKTDEKQDSEMLMNNIRISMFHIREQIRINAIETGRATRTRAPPERLDPSTARWERYDANAFDRAADIRSNDPLDTTFPHREEGRRRAAARSEAKEPDAPIGPRADKARRAPKKRKEIRRNPRIRNLNFSPFAPDFELPDVGIIAAAQTAEQHRAEMAALIDTYGTANVRRETMGDNAIEVILVKDKLFIPDNKELITRILTVAHCGNAGHRSFRVSVDYLKEHVYWPTMIKDMQDFKDTCLNCVKDQTGARIPRPLGDQLKASYRGEIISMDYCYIAPKRSTNTHLFVYILVIKDEFSGFVELIPCEHANHEHAANEIIKWISRYGCIPRYVRSDQGSHFLNKLIQNLMRRLNAKQHLVTPYCPWANGSVEIVNKTMIEVLTTIILERNLKPDDWPYIIPVVMNSINGTKSERLGDHAPRTVFMGMPANNPLEVCFLPDRPDIRDRLQTLDISNSDRIKRSVEKLFESLADIHAVSTATKQKFQVMREKSYIRSHGLQDHPLVDFQIGDYVLIAIPTKATKHKLRAVWRGPYKITQQQEPYVYQAQHLVTNAFIEAHITRIKFYADAEVDLTIPQVLDHISNEEFDGYLIETILDNRVHRNEMELFIRWKGLHELENTWEPLREIYDFFKPQLNEYLTTLPIDHQLHDVIEMWDNPA